MRRRSLKPICSRLQLYRRLVLIGTAFATSIPLPAYAEPRALDIKQLTLEQLMDIDVYSASRRLEPVQGVPSAMYVLTGEDIRRARVTSVPEALRLVPGVQVARVDANKWAVTIRGYTGGFDSGRIANKLLVLVDGRSIYDPLFAGTLWEARDVMLEDIERIEVIRGPGGALWGANAVNGVINIITKHARDTQGGLVTTGVGSEEHGFGAARYGWQSGDNRFTRVYAKAYARGAGFSPTGSAHDETRMAQTGFRSDWGALGRDALRVSGDWFSNESGQRDSATVTQDVDHRGGNLLAQWTRQISATENVRAQFFYDRIELDTLTLGEKRNTYDLELQHNFAAAHHAIVWGLGLRSTRDRLRVTQLALSPTERSDQTRSAFIQDTIALAPDKLQLTFGTKVEDNDYSGVEWQPNARLAWTPDAQQTYWAAASRAVRIPTRLEADLTSAGARLGDDFDSERVHAYELGHRRLLTSTFWYDVATFYNIYDNLMTIEQNLQFRNGMSARAYGVELAGRWQATPAWRLDSAYTYLRTNLTLDAASGNALIAPASTEKSNPRHQVAFRSAYDLGRDFQFDAILRFVDDLPALNVPSYTALDLGLAWFIRRDLEWWLVGQNLLDGHHPEQTVTGNGLGTEVQRGFYTKLTWRF